MSRNDPVTAFPAVRTMHEMGLPLSRIVLTPSHDFYALAQNEAFRPDWFITVNDTDVKAMAQSHIAASLISGPERAIAELKDRLHLSWDFDRVLGSHVHDREFGDTAQDDIPLFLAHEIMNLDKPIKPGLFRDLALTFGQASTCSQTLERHIVNSCITARSDYAALRTMRSFMEYGLDMDVFITVGTTLLDSFTPEAVPQHKTEALITLRDSYTDHLTVFFDDSRSNIARASQEVICMQVPRVDDDLRHALARSP